ncbi:MAG: T9SS type A sorting domain-containing protein [Calditrichaeota bacterium]|nr:T9SS type A sorting domain-containing protein [Calditrichota bacterium]MCB9369751.1 T9SS type A sorting domain-containing protein [Calditrichota bacterium]
MKYILLFLLIASQVGAQYRQLSGASGSVAGKASSPTHATTALVGQPVVNDAAGGEFGTRGGIASIFEEIYVSLDADAADGAIPSDFSFSQNFPNPFNPSTTFEFALPKLSRATLVVYDELGREAGRVFDREFAAGNYTVQFVAPPALASGVYFAVFQAEDYRQVKKIVLLK